jgi:hypothetical protein
LAVVGGGLLLGGEVVWVWVCVGALECVVGGALECVVMDGAVECVVVGVDFFGLWLTGRVALALVVVVGVVAVVVVATEDVVAPGAALV